MLHRLITPKCCLKCVLSVGFITALYFIYLTIVNNYIVDDKSEYFQNDILKTPQIYEPERLHEWVPAPIVAETPGMPGELGRPVELPPSDELNEKFKEHEFNIVVSDLISANRSLTDKRNPLCLAANYPNKLPTTSLIIIFHNEAWSTLVRTLWSVINRSPTGLVKEIILVDDASTFDFLGNQLDEYVSTLPIQTKVLRMGERSGLIRARLRGAENAQGDVLTFLDAHCECMEGWLEPLLSRVAENRRIVAIPIIDIIKDDTLEYVLANDQLWGGFDWKLGYR